jgi:predicted RNA-binding protein with TRAM domain
MDIPDSLISLFHGSVTDREGHYTIEIPSQEVDAGALEADETYRVAVLRASGGSESAGVTHSEHSPDRHSGGSARAADGPPVTEDEVREVEIEDMGEQGDGIARIGPGYIVFVSDTNVGDRVRVRITSTRENFAFAEPVTSE